MKLLKSSIWSFFAVLLRGVSALSINKLFAVYFGPSGIALLAHFQNLTTIFTTIPNDGINRGVIRFLSPNSFTTKEKQQYFSAGFYLNILVFIVTLAVTLIFQDYFTEKFKTGSPLWIVIFAASMLFLLLDYLLLAIILAFRNTVHFFLVEFAGSLIFFIYLYISLTYYSISIQAALTHYMVALSLGFVIVSVMIFMKSTYRDCISFKIPSIKIFKKLNGFLVMALTAVLFQKGIDFYIREFSIESFGGNSTGIWQGVVKISDYYMMAFTSVMMIAFYPQITSSLHNSKILKKVLFDGIKLYVPLIIFGCLFVFFAKEILLEYLLDAEFLSGADYIHWQLMGDFLKMISMILGLLMLAQAKIKWFIIGEFLSAAAYILFINYFQDEQILGILKAHFYRYIVYFLYLMIYYRKLLFK